MKLPMIPGLCDVGNGSSPDFWELHTNGFLSFYCLQSPDERPGHRRQWENITGNVFPRLIMPEGCPGWSRYPSGPRV